MIPMLSMPNQFWKILEYHLNPYCSLKCCIIFLYNNEITNVKKNLLPGWISISSLLKNSLWIKGESKESRSVRLIRPPMAWPETDSLKNACLI